MKSKRIHTDYLRDMIEYAEKAERFVPGIQFEDFQNDEEKTLAVVRALEIIGEAAKHINQKAITTIFPITSRVQ